jgi:hypothetical protein
MEHLDLIKSERQLIRQHPNFLAYLKENRLSISKTMPYFDGNDFGVKIDNNDEDLLDDKGYSFDINHY